MYGCETKRKNLSEVKFAPTEKQLNFTSQALHPQTINQSIINQSAINQQSSPIMASDPLFLNIRGYSPRSTNQSLNHNGSNSSLNHHLIPLPLRAGASTVFSVNSNVSAASQQQQRASNACDLCRRRKTKCSGTKPCSYCVAHSLECCYNYVRKKRITYKKNPKPELAASSSNSSIGNISNYASNHDDANSNNVNGNGNANRNGNSSSSANNITWEFAARLDKIENTMSSLTEKLDNVFKMNEALWDKLNTLAPSSTSNTMIKAEDDIPSNNYPNIKTNGHTCVLAHGVEYQSSTSTSAGRNSTIHHKRAISNVTADNNNNNNSSNSDNKQMSPPYKKPYRCKDTMRISQILQDTGPDKKAHQILVDEFVGLVNTATSVTIFSPRSLKWLKHVTGSSFRYFEPITRQHSQLLAKITKSLKEDFNSSTADMDFLLKRKPIVKFLLSIFLKLNIKSLLLSSDEVCDSLVHNTLALFLEATTAKELKFNHSEHLILNAIVCLGCIYASATVYQVNGAASESPQQQHNQQQEPDAAIYLSNQDLLEIEKVAMKNCFFHFHRLVNHNDGQITVIGILLLCVYLSSTIFSRCNYLILAIAASHAQRLGYHKIKFNYHVGKSLNFDALSKQMLWAKCFMSDRDVSYAIEKPPLIKDETSLTDADFLTITKFAIARYCRNHGLESNDELQSLDAFKLEANSTTIPNTKEFFQILHNFATYSTTGFSIFVNYFSFSLTKLLSKYTREVYLNSVLRNLTIDENARVNDEEFLNSFFKSLDVVSELNVDMDRWILWLPDTINPANEVDITKYAQSNETLIYGTQNNQKILEKAVANDKKVYLHGYDFDAITESAGVVSSNMGTILIIQFKYFYNLMKANKIAHNSCILLFKRRELFKNLTMTKEQQKRLENDLTSRAQAYEEAYLISARKILNLSISVSRYSCQVVYWGVHFILGAYFAIFIHLVHTLANDKENISGQLQQQSIDTCVAELHLLTECYFCCFSKPFFIIRHLNSNFVEYFSRGTIQLCLAQLRKKTDYDVDGDSQFVRFFAHVKQFGDKGDVKLGTADTSGTTNNSTSAKNLNDNTNDSPTKNKQSQNLADVSTSPFNNSNVNNGTNVSNLQNINNDGINSLSNFPNVQPSRETSHGDRASLSSSSSFTDNLNLNQFIDNSFSLAFSKDVFDKNPSSSSNPPRAMGHTFSTRVHDGNNPVNFNNNSNNNNNNNNNNNLSNFFNGVNTGNISVNGNNTGMSLENDSMRSDYSSAPLLADGALFTFNNDAQNQPANQMNQGNLTGAKTATTLPAFGYVNSPITNPVYGTSGARTGTNDNPYVATGSPLNYRVSQQQQQQQYSGYPQNGPTTPSNQIGYMNNQNNGSNNTNADTSGGIHNSANHSNSGSNNGGLAMDNVFLNLNDIDPFSINSSLFTDLDNPSMNFGFP